jgi:hypothetical protein
MSSLTNRGRRKFLMDTETVGTGVPVSDRSLSATARWILLESSEHDPDSVSFTGGRLNAENGALVLLVGKELQHGDTAPSHVPWGDVVLIGKG